VPSGVAQDRNFHFPLLADFELKGEVSRRYGVYRADDDTSERTLYLIDADGIVRWSYASPVGVNPRATGSFTPSRARGISRTEWEARLTEPVDGGAAPRRVPARLVSVRTSALSPADRSASS
jgi:hypothetical protein